MEKGIDVVSKIPCIFCTGSMVAIKKATGSYLVQCLDCGAITTVANTNVSKSPCKPSRVKNLRKIQRRQNRCK